MNVNVILKDEELKILFRAAGGKELFSFVNDNCTQKVNIPYLVHEMVRRGVMRYCNEELIVNEPYHTMIKGMAEAKYILTLHKGEAEETEQIIYVGNKLFRMTSSEKDQACVRICERDKVEIANDLDELFCPLRSSDCPEELLDESMRNEKGVLSASAELHIPENEKFYGLEKKWTLFCGRYRNYITEQSRDYAKDIEYKNWNSQIILQDMEEIR